MEKNYKKQFYKYFIFAIVDMILSVAMLCVGIIYITVGSTMLGLFLLVNSAVDISSSYHYLAMSIDMRKSIEALGNIQKELSTSDENPR